MAFNYLNRKEEQKGFVVLWRLGVREAHWKRLVQDKDLARRVAAAFQSKEMDLISYGDQSLEEDFSEVDLSTGRVCKWRVFAQDTNVREILADSASVHTTKADILATIADGHLSKTLSHLFFLSERSGPNSCSQIEVSWNDDGWYIDRSFTHDNQRLQAGMVSAPIPKL